MQIVETYWRNPISVRLQNGLEHTFHSVQDTLDFLENEWPTLIAIAQPFSVKPPSTEVVRRRLRAKPLSPPASRPTCP